MSMRLLVALVGALCATLVASVTIPVPSIPSITGFGQLSAAQVVQSGRPPALLEPGGEAPGPAFSGAWLRRRETRVNVGLLGTITAGMAPALTLNLFSDVELLAVFERMEATNPGSVWVGHLEDEPMSSATLAVVDGVLSGQVSHAGGLYEITADADGAAVVSRLDPSRIQGDEPVGLLSRGAWPPDPDAGLSAAGGELTVITVANFYTKAAKKRAGGPAAIKASIAGNIARTNTAYIESGVDQRIKQVSVRQINYKETGSISTDLIRLADTTDRFMKSAHTVRNAKKADLVSLIVSQAVTWRCGGVAYTPSNGPPGDTGAFSVIEFPLCMADIVYAHELGHNMGLMHDWYASDDTGTFNYGHGHVDTKKKFVTIMAYLSHCQALGLTCTRYALFSNPKKKFLGRKTGVGGKKTKCKAGKTKPSNCAANAARALNNTGKIVAAFR